VTGRNLVNLESVSLRFGVEPVLDGISLGIAEGDRIGVVGRNGGGKTTLTRVLTGDIEPDSGRVTRAGGLTVSRLLQADDLVASRTVREVVVGERADHTWASDSAVRTVLVGLFGDLQMSGFNDGLDTPVGHLSGGQRRRVDLARVLIAPSDLVILDEPTNHLDVEGIDWLARHLAAMRAALVVVTHDRWLLDEVCSRTWEVADGQVHDHDGGYSAYVLARAERERQEAASDHRRRQLVRKELAWLRRGPPARTSKPQFRIDAAQTLIAEEPPARNTVELTRFASARLGRSVYDAKDAALTLGGKELLTSLTWSLGPGDRVGIVGVNGSGKTSLLRMLAGELRPAAGRVSTGVTVRTGYLSQTVAELDTSLRVVEAVEQVARVVQLGGGREMTASQLAERLGFAGGRQWTQVSRLSGGERRRLQLVRLLMSEPNVLLLDEPTNDLDIETLVAVEDLLDDWPGSLVVVSHDRYFLERVTDTIWSLPGDTSLRHLPGGVAEFLDRHKAGSVTPVPVTERVASLSDAAVSRTARKELARLERQLDRLATRESRLHSQLADRAADYPAVAALDAELRQLATEREELETRWLTAAEG
jgi:ABC transport system ATP-binding/permease protein